ncbi:MAG: hypothetical protein HQL37_09780 [Alphaproteobacteria bacterium]|nr:hypothetical protein [Alphaproteobacteria bacterium]
MDDRDLRDKLRKIETLFAGAATAGERAAAGAAAERIRARLKQVGDAERAIEMTFSLRNPWSHRLFVALCRRYGLRAYRYRRMRHTSVCVRAPESFLNSVLWPEFLQLDAALTEHLTDITDRIIREEVYRDVSDADEVEEPLKIAQGQA